MNIRQYEQICFGYFIQNVLQCWHVVMQSWFRCLGSTHILTLSGLAMTTMLLIHRVGFVTDIMWPSLMYLSSCSVTLACKATGQFRGAHSGDTLPDSTGSLNTSYKLKINCCFVRGMLSMQQVCEAPLGSKSESSGSWSGSTTSKNNLCLVPFTVHSVWNTISVLLYLAAGDLQVTLADRPVFFKCWVNEPSWTQGLYCVNAFLNNEKLTLTVGCLLILTIVHHYIHSACPVVSLSGLTHLGKMIQYTTWSTRLSICRTLLSAFFCDHPHNTSNTVLSVCSLLILPSCHFSLCACVTFTLSLILLLIAITHISKLQFVSSHSSGTGWCPH